MPYYDEFGNEIEIDEEEEFEEGEGSAEDDEIENTEDEYTEWDGRYTMKSYFLDPLTEKAVGPFDTPQEAQVELNRRMEVAFEANKRNEEKERTQ